MRIYYTAVYQFPHSCVCVQQLALSRSVGAGIYSSSSRVPEKRPGYEIKPPSGRKHIHTRFTAMHMPFEILPRGAVCFAMPRETKFVTPTPAYKTASQTYSCTRPVSIVYM